MGRQPPAAGPGSYFPLRDVSPEGAEVRLQVCGREAAARGAAIFGDFGAAGAPPAAREATARAVPSRQAAGPESPAGRGVGGSNGRGPRRAPRLI